MPSLSLAFRRAMNSCWGLGTWLGSTPSLASPLLTSLTRTSEKAGVIHPVRVATCWGLPQIWCRHRAVAGGEVKPAGTRAHGQCMPGGKGAGGRQGRALLSWVSKSQALPFRTRRSEA